jgi:hypothetical protein
MIYTCDGLSADMKTRTEDKNEITEIAEDMIHGINLGKNIKEGM